MTAGDRDGLIARIRQVRRVAAVRDRPAVANDPTERLRAVETRMAHLERMVEDLQDSVHREAERHERVLGEIQAQIRPGAMGAALADDARHRGL